MKPCQYRPSNHQIVNHPAFLTQWALTLHAYFQTWDQPAGSTPIDFKHTFHAHSFFRDYVWFFWKEIHRRHKTENVDSSTLNQIRITFKLISRILADHLVIKDHQQALDCLFYAASLYTQICRQILPNHAVLEEQVDRLIPNLMRCKAQISARGSRFGRAFSGGIYDQDQEMVVFSEAWWSILSPPKEISSSSGTKIA